LTWHILAGTRSMNFYKFCKRNILLLFDNLKIDLDKYEI